MSDILLIGTDASLLEGISQTLSAVGFIPAIAHSFADAMRLASATPPLLTIVNRTAVGSGADLLRVPLARGGAVILYRTLDEHAPALPAPVQRAVLADLLLPLERARLVALLHTVIERARHTTGGRVAPDDDAPVVPVP